MSYCSHFLDANSKGLTVKARLDIPLQNLLLILYTHLLFISTNSKNIPRPKKLKLHYQTLLY